MQNSTAPIEQYQKMYVDLDMERRGLFALIREKYQPKEVLYPGCSIHITPAFYFPHMVFVDHSPTAKTFFANLDTLHEFVSRHRNYRRTPFLQFIAQDFTQPLPVRKNQFDLLLALFAGGITQACKAYLRVGGLLLTNNHQNDAADAIRDQELAPVAIIEHQQDRYRLTYPRPGQTLELKGQASRPKRYLRPRSTGVEYIENERYYLFERTRSRQ